jgi:hypothetical protein
MPDPAENCGGQENHPEARRHGGPLSDGYESDTRNDTTNLKTGTEMKMPTVDPDVLTRVRLVGSTGIAKINI